MHSPLSLRSVFTILLAMAILLGAGILVSAPGNPYGPQDKAYYADSNLVNFVRPGLQFRILSAQIAPDGTISVRFRITDPRGLPLDRLGVTTPGTVSTSFVAAYIPKGQSQYVAYTTRRQTSPITNQTAVQASNDTGGTYQTVGEGEYIYTFGTKAPATLDRSATHTISLYGNRNLTEFDMGINLAETTFNFVPDGSPVQVVRDIVKTETCNKCHDRLQLHGTTGRTTVPGCILCHQPQTTDPDTGNTVDMVTMIHKIHMGAQLPSVRAGGKYQIIGFNQSVHDYSNVVLPAPVNDCTVCHESGKGAKQENIWYEKPSRQACGSCHDNVNFATGEGHLNLPQLSDNRCATCHTPEGELEFDASIKGAHTTPRFSKALPGTVFQLHEARGRAGEKPVVVFSVLDKNGSPYDLKTFTRLALVLAGPTTDYTTYVSEDPRANAVCGADGRCTYTFNASLPADAKGTWSIGIEGYNNAVLLPGTRKEMTVRDAGVNKVIHFSVDGSRLVARRAVVSNEKCNACHGSLSLHGDNRNRVEQCVLCHNPVSTDAAVRPADKKPDESINFSTMIHRIHSGEEMPRDYTIYGFRSTPHNYNHVAFPGNLSNCSMCHVGTSNQVPLPATASPVTDPRGLLNPVGPETNACTSCHHSVAAASHALVNTSRLGESCAACHGPNADFSVARSHALVR